MRIYHRDSGRKAAPRDGVYQCFPPGKNTVARGKSFKSIEETALFLLRNPDWKVWVASNATHADGQVSKEVVIEGTFDRDDLKKKHLIP